MAASVIGPYQVLGELGRGAQGVVLRGRAVDGREVALKLPGTLSPARLERFAREQRLLAELDDQARGFVPLLEVLNTAQGPCLVMPLLRGGTLRQRLADGPLSVPELLRVGRTLALSLGAAHARGIVHRDLKPENVLFDGGGQPLIADLGLAKRYEDEPGPLQIQPLSVTGELRGTPAYMAPEQMTDAKRAGPPADVFALGAILYEGLCGVPPHGRSAAEALGSSGRHVKPVRVLAPHTPGWLSAVIDRCLAPDPADRYPHAAALAEALVEPPRHARAPLVAAAAILLLGAGTAGALLARRPEPEPPRPVTAPVPPAPKPPPGPPPEPPPEPAPPTPTPADPPPAPPGMVVGSAEAPPGALLGVLDQFVRPGRHGPWTITRRPDVLECRNDEQADRVQRFFVELPRSPRVVRARVSVSEAGPAGELDPGAGIMFGAAAGGDFGSYWIMLARRDGSVALLRQEAGRLQMRMSTRIEAVLPQRLLEVHAIDGGFQLRVDGQVMSGLTGPRCGLGQRVGLVALGRGSFGFHSFELER